MAEAPCGAAPVEVRRTTKRSKQTSYLVAVVTCRSASMIYNKTFEFTAAFRGCDILPKALLLQEEQKFAMKVKQEAQDIMIISECTMPGP